jgi:hypothetical protein
MLLPQPSESWDYGLHCHAHKGTSFLVISFKRWKRVNTNGSHTCDSNYSGGRDQGDHGSKTTLGKQFARLYLEIIQHKKGLAE